MALPTRSVVEESRRTADRLMQREARNAQEEAWRLGTAHASATVPAVGEVYAPEAEAWVAEFELDAIARLNRDRARRVATIIGDGVRRGLAEQAVWRDINRVVRGGEGRARTIARTEMNRAANWGTLTAYRLSGVVESKEAIATMDRRTRPSHMAADGEVVPIDEPFTLGAAAGLLAPPWEPNCRCTIAPSRIISPDQGAADDLADLLDKQLPRFQPRTPKGTRQRPARPIPSGPEFRRQVARAEGQIARAQRAYLKSGACTIHLNDGASARRIEGLLEQDTLHQARLAAAYLRGWRGLLG